MLFDRWPGSCVACLVLALAGCTASPPKPAEARVVVAAAADVNPDGTGRPSPVVVRIYQLRGDAEFKGADFFALYDREKQTLGASLIVREERTLFPGQRLAMSLPLSPEARFVAVAAAFRDVRASRWRAIAGVPEKPLLKVLAKRRITVSIGKDAVDLSATD